MSFPARRVLANPIEEFIRQTYNNFASREGCEKQEIEHSDVAEQTLALMGLRPGERILDLGCGTGWATRRLAQRVFPGKVVGVDISDAMVQCAEERSGPVTNVRFLRASAEDIPCADNCFDKVFSIESFYYYPDQGAVLDQLRRVLAPGGRFFICMFLYKDNPYAVRSQQAHKVPVCLRSAAEYVALISRHGFDAAETRFLPDRTPTPDEYSDKVFKNAAELRECREMGALLLMATAAKINGMVRTHV